MGYDVLNGINVYSQISHLLHRYDHEHVLYLPRTSHPRCEQRWCFRSMPINHKIVLGSMVSGEKGERKETVCRCRRVTM